MKYRRIRLEGLLDTHDIEVDGLTLSAKVDIEIRQLGSNSMEIDYVDIGDIFISNRVYDFIKLDQEAIKAINLYHRFVNACELLALKKAKEAQDFKWSYEEEVAV